MKKLVLSVALLALAASAGGGGLSPNVQAVFYQWHRTLDFDGYWRHWDEPGKIPPEDIGSCFYPVLNPYSSADPVAVEKQMEWLKRAGVGAIMMSMWDTGGYPEQATSTTMTAAAAKGIRCGFYMEPWQHDGTYRNITDLETQVRYFHDTYGSLPAAFWISRPTKWGPSTAPRLVFGGFCDTLGITTAEWAAYLDRVRGTAYDPLYLGGAGDGATMDACHWDGINTYAPFFSPSQYAPLNNDVTSRGGVLAATVSPGFDNTRIGGTLVQSRQNGARYDDMWNGAKNANPEFVHVVSFNEWGESTIIEPAKPKSISGYTYQDYGALGSYWYLDRTAYWKTQWKGGQIENAAYMADTIPSAMEAGETRDVSVVMMNTGDTTWTQAAGHKLGGYGDSDPFASTRHELDPSASVISFETYTFTFPFTAPSTPGTYHTDWQMVHELVRWFGDIRPYKDITVLSASSANNAQFTADTIPAVMIKGQSYQVSITVRNTGTTTWTQTAGYNLSAVGGSDPLAGTWYGMNSGESVAPSQTRSFTFTMTAPSIAGYYVTDWRMAQSTTPFGRELKRIVQVIDPGSIPPVSGLAASAGNGRIALTWTNPSDWDLTRVMIRCRTDTYPASETDGALVIDKPGTPEAADGYVHAGLTNGQTYYYTLFAHDGIGNFSIAATAVATPWNVTRQTISTSAFNSSADGWNIATWKAGTSSNGTMAWNSGAGNPGGGMRSTGYSSTDDSDRCKREGGEISKTISTSGYRHIIVSYDLRVNSLGQNRTGAGTGSCTVDHNLIDEQLTVFYSTDGGSSWKEAEYLTRSQLLAYQTYGTRTIDLSAVAGVADNINFALRFRWQFNTSSDQGDLDNIIVTVEPIDPTPPGPVASFTAVAGQDAEVTLSWTNPSDPDFTGAMIRCRNDTYPADPSDGALAADKANVPGSTDTFVHTGLNPGQTYYYSAFARDWSPNYSSVAHASAVPILAVCLNEPFAYPNGNLNGNGGWSGTAAAQIAVDSQNVKISGGSGAYDAARTVVCGDPGELGVDLKIKKGLGAIVIWNVWIDDTSNKNLARWFGTGTQLRGRIGTGSQLTALQNLTGGWDELYVRIDQSTDHSRFYFNGVLIGTLSHAETGAGDLIGRVRFERVDSPAATGQYILFDDLKLGMADVTAPVASVGAPSVAVTRAGPVSYTVTFGEPVYGFSAASDIQLNSTGTAAGSVSVTGSGAGPYTVSLSNLTGGGTLGITVKAAACADGAGNANPAGSPRAVFTVLASDGSIRVAKALLDGAHVELGNKALYLKWPNLGYVEELNRTAGIQLQGSLPVNEGDLVCLTGTIHSHEDGERYITVEQISSCGTHSIKPLAASNRSLNLPLMDGLFVKAWLQVRPGSITGSSFILTDGSDATGIKVLTQGSPAVSDGDFITITGAAGSDDGARMIYRK